MRFIALLITAAAAPLLAAPAHEAARYGNFSLSCTGVDLFHNFFLGATCCHPSDDDGAVEIQSENELDLTMCIGLNQASGHMQWEVYGKFSNYCTNCTVEAAQGEAEHLLSCYCTPLIGDRGPMLSTLNLDDGIANDWGTLKCAGGMASSPRPHGRGQN